MKKLFVISLLLFVFSVSSVNAKEVDDFIDLDKSEVNVYIFHGEGCGYCANALSFFEGIEEEYGKYFNLFTYEVWYDSDNANLMMRVGEYFDKDITGVPFIVIGKKTYSGFSTAWEKNIISSIVDEYNKDFENRFDVMTALENDALFLDNFVPTVNNENLYFIIEGIVEDFLFFINNNIFSFLH